MSGEADDLQGEEMRLTKTETLRVLQIDHSTIPQAHRESDEDNDHSSQAAMARGAGHAQQRAEHTTEPSAAAVSPGQHQLLLKTERNSTAGES